MSRIVLGVSGSIAAFKAAALASLLVQDGHEIRVVLTEGGAKFVTALTFEALTSHPVAHDIWAEVPGSSRMGHLELARWVEVLVVAPASAATIARLALGLGNDLLGAVALATRAPLVLAPAMETGMWEHPATQGHVETLRQRGAHFVGPTEGHLASGVLGSGRLADPVQIASEVAFVAESGRALDGMRVLVTAGPTREPIDPVRYLGNRSSGKMGFAVAEVARARGADVLLITGPTSIVPPVGVTVQHVETTEELRDATLQHAPAADVIVMAAAVADFRPALNTASKFKRQDGLSIDLVPNPDISAELPGAAPNAYRVGFALETDNVLENARAKLERKGLHLIVANAVTEVHTPFGSEDNQVWIVTPDTVTALPLLPKRQAASAIWDAVQDEMAARGEASSAHSASVDEKFEGASRPTDG